jgi:hypothetical protein
MTLKEKFEQWFINDEEDEHYEGMVNKVAIEHEQIADEFAIDFADWIRVCQLKRRSYDFDNIEELLTIYKEEKGL